jgi:hypothetical protein
MTVCVQIRENGVIKRVQVPANDIEIEIDGKKAKLIDFLLTTTARVDELEKNLQYVSGHIYGFEKQTNEVLKTVLKSLETISEERE